MIVTGRYDDEDVGAEVEEVTDADGGDVAKLVTHPPRFTGCDRKEGWLA